MASDSSLTMDTLTARIIEELDDMQLTELHPDSVFTELEGWNSLYGLILMALTSTEYDIELTGEQIKSIKTVRDLYNIIQAHH